MPMKLLAPQPAGKHMAFLQENPRSHLISALAVFSRLRAQEFPLLILRMAVEVLSRLQPPGRSCTTTAVLGDELGK